jgi:hypothetical protein
MDRCAICRVIMRASPVIAVPDAGKSQADSIFYAQNADTGQALVVHHRLEI